jgi:CRP/FNR family transcriptional regulator, cyclic AMP receptor protein
MADVLQEVSTIPLFHGIDEQQRERLLKFALVEEFEPGRTLFSEGSALGQIMYVVLSGEVDILKRDEKSQQVHLATLTRNAFFGEMSLFEQEKRSATAKVKTTARLLVLTKSNFDRMMMSDPGIANKMLLAFIRTLVDRLRSTSDQVVGHG